MKDDRDSPSSRRAFPNRAKEPRKRLEDGLLAIVDQELYSNILSNNSVVRTLRNSTVVSIKMDAMRIKWDVWEN